MREEYKPVDYQLSKTLRYSFKGEFEETATITMHPPGMDVFDQTSNLSQLVMGAFSEAGRAINQEAVEKAKENSDGEELDGNAVKMMLFSSQSIKFTDVAKEFKRLAVRVCYVADGIKILDEMFNEMGIDDFVGLVCEYIVNFITPSLLPE
jgi:hypothetical protein